MNLRRVIPGATLHPPTRWRRSSASRRSGATAARVTARAAPFLFGQFTIADAMYAPVVTRFRTYEIELDDVCAAYADALWALPAMHAWCDAAAKETIVIDKFEY